MAGGSSWINGNISGVIKVQSGAMRLAGTATSRPPPNAAAKADKVGWPNNTFTSADNPRRRMRPIRLTASSECPPNSKKLS